MRRIPLDGDLPEDLRPDDLVELPNRTWRRFGKMDELDLHALEWWHREQGKINAAAEDYSREVRKRYGLSGGDLLWGILEEWFGELDEDEYQPLRTLVAYRRSGKT